MMSKYITFSQLYAHWVFGLPLPPADEKPDAFCRECGGPIFGKGLSAFPFNKIYSDKWLDEDVLIFKNSWTICPACYTIRKPAGDYSPVREKYSKRKNKQGKFDQSINSQMRQSYFMQIGECLLIHSNGILLGKDPLDKDNRYPRAFLIFDYLPKIVPPFALCIGQGGDSKRCGYYYHQVPLNWSFHEEIDALLVGEASFQVRFRWKKVLEVCNEIFNRYPDIRFVQYKNDLKEIKVDPDDLIKEIRTLADKFNLWQEESRICELLFRFPKNAKN